MQDTTRERSSPGRALPLGGTHIRGADEEGAAPSANSPRRDAASTNGGGRMGLLQRLNATVRDTVQRSLPTRTPETDAEADNILRTLTSEFRRQWGQPNPEGDAGAAAAANGPVAADPMQPLPPLPDGVTHGEISSFARWVEESAPFCLLLLAVFLYRHLISMLILLWLTTLHANANERMRKQTLLKEKSRSALLHLAGLIFAEIACISLLQNPEMLASQLTMRRVIDFSPATAPPLSGLVWDILLTDLCARAILLEIKVGLALVSPDSATRRLKRVYAAVEALGAVYRMLLPMPLWFHWLMSLGQDVSTPALWTFGTSHMYLGFKLMALVDRAKHAAAAARYVSFRKASIEPP